MHGFLGCYTERSAKSTGASGISAVTLAGAHLSSQAPTAQLPVSTRAAQLAVHPAAGVVNPTYLALAGDGSVLYAALEVPAGGAIAAFGVDGASLAPLGTPQLTGGARSAHLSVHPAGYVLSADYGDGLLTVHPTNADGTLNPRSGFVQLTGSGPNPDRQQSAHAHMITPTPDGSYVLAIDLGTDSVFRYTIGDGELELDATCKVPAGAGPRHLAFHPALPLAYVANELVSTVSVLDLDRFTIMSTVPTIASPSSTASHPSAIRVSDDRRFCYVANRGVDTIATLAISGDGASLELISTVPCGGEHPRDMTLAGRVLVCANQFSNTLSTFRLDETTGVPAPVGHPVSTPAPSCIVLTPH